VQASYSPFLSIVAVTLAQEVNLRHVFPTTVYIVAEPQVVRVNVP